MPIKEQQVPRAGKKKQPKNVQSSEGGQALSSSMPLIDYEELYNSAPIGLGYLDRDLRYVEINESLAKMHGYPREHHLGRKLQEILPTLFPEVEPLYRYVLDSGEPLLNMELSGITEVEPKEQKFWVASFYPIKFPDGIVSGVSTVVQDATERKKREKSLAEKQQEVLAQLEHTPLAALALDLNLRATHWNLATEKLFGYSREEALGRHLTNLIVSDDILQSQVSEIFDKVLSRKGGEININENITKDGRRIICEWHNTPLFDSTGDVIGIASIGQDITERRKLMDALIDSEKRYKTLFDTIPHAIQELTILGKITLSNSSFSDLLGYSKEELQNKPIFELMPCTNEQTELETYLEHLFSTLETPKPFFAKMRTKSGEIIDLQLDIAYVKDQEQRVTAFIFACTNITQRKQAEHALLFSEKRYQTLASLSPVGFFHTNSAGEYMYVNSSWSQITGQSAEQAKGHGWLTGLFSDDRQRITDEWFLAINKQSQFKTECRFQKPDGSVSWVILEAKRMAVQNFGSELQGYVGAVTDITKLRAADEQIRQDQLKLAHFSRLNTVGEMVSGIAHEVNQPLTSIVHYIGGCMERLRQEGGAIEIIQIMQRVMCLAERAGSIIHSLKEFLRKGELQKQLIDLNELVHNSLRLTEQELREERVQVELALDRHLPIIKVDKIQIEQVIVNLISNAIDAMEQEPKKLHIATGIRQEMAFIRVADNGIGIPDAIAEKILTPFFTTKKKGMGLGLAISRSIVENHGGKLAIIPGKEKGTCIDLLLPLSLEEIDDGK